ncbi:MAG: thioredoxin domain-containing protein [Desulfobacterales bacterium]|jgi:thioredoxin 2|nr:thioredoxin domain-containing protein [Desulfobacterales bacterium]
MSNHIIRCPECGAANRIPADKIGVAAKCGKCHTLLPGDPEKTAPGQAIQMRCTQCGAKNKIPEGKLDAGGKCGKCGALLKTEELFEPQPVMVTDSNFDVKVLKSPLPVLLFAWAPWCPTCGSVTPIIDEFASSAKGKVRVGKINVDANPMLASKYNIMSVPFLFIFDNGQMKESMPGGLQKHEIMMKMAPYI